MNEMNPQESLPEELLSAYLDGELPSDERARVEAWLASNAEHRRLFDDLQAIRRELQALPQQSLDAAFSDRVLATIRLRNGELAKPVAEIKPNYSSPAQRTLSMPAWRWFAAGMAASLATVLLGANFAPEAMSRVGLVAVRTQEVALRDGLDKSREKLEVEKAQEATPSQAADKAPAKNEQPSPDNQLHESLVRERRGDPKPSEPAAGEATLEKKSNAQRDLQRQLIEPTKKESAEPPSAPALARTEPARNAPEAKLDSDRRAAGLEGKANASVLAFGSLPDREIAVSSQQAEKILSLATSADTPQRSFRKVTTADHFALGVQLSALEVTGPEAEVEQLLRSVKAESMAGVPAALSAATASGDARLAEKELLDQDRLLEGTVKQKSAKDEAAGGSPGPPKPGAAGLGAQAENVGKSLAGGKPINAGAPAGRARGASRVAAKSFEEAAQPAADSKPVGRQVRVRLVVVPAAQNTAEETPN